MQLIGPEKCTGPAGLTISKLGLGQGQTLQASEVAIALRTLLFVSAVKLLPATGSGALLLLSNTSH